MAKRLPIVMLAVAAGLILGWLGLRAGLMFLFLGRFSPPTTQDFVAIARRYQPVVQSTYDFRAEHGIWPQGLGELIPGYLAVRPAGPNVVMENGVLSIPTGFPHTYVTYSFQSGNEGWSAAGDFGTGPLPLPKGAATRPAVTGEALVRARLAEYDRRIAAAEAQGTAYRYFVQANYTQKIAYLLSLGRREAALDACRAAERAMPEWWRPRMVALTLINPDEAPSAEADFRAWVDQRPTFIHYWYLSRYYRDKGRHDEAIAALRQAATHSLAEFDGDAAMVPDGYAFDAAAYACQQRDPELVLQITALWQKPRGIYNYHNDNLHAFRAAAELALGRFDAAKTDLNRVLEAHKTQGLWAGNLDQLQRAVDARDRTFVYHPGNLPGGWTLLPPPE